MMIRHFHLLLVWHRGCLELQLRPRLLLEERRRDDAIGRAYHFGGILCRNHWGDSRRTANVAGSLIVVGCFLFLAVVKNSTQRLLRALFLHLLLLLLERLPENTTLCQRFLENRNRVAILVAVTDVALALAPLSAALSNNLVPPGDQDAPSRNVVVQAVFSFHRAFVFVIVVIELRQVNLVEVTTAPPAERRLIAIPRLFACPSVL
mmetsp:Transcript_52896/g.158342  ORF Transcript_52896/g.158342 Transcript_52896/m.158342 type:complete len:206 (+) Transcript_52896:611-1228(+)